MTATVSLLVLAGGMGSRFGGDKQLATVGHTGRPLLYFSVMDAYRAGVRHLVLVIRQNLQTLFIEQVLPTLPADLKVEFVVQQLDDIPPGCVLPTVARANPGARRMRFGRRVSSCRSLLLSSTLMIITVPMRCSS